jgi:hypothetical protein
MNETEVRKFLKPWLDQAETNGRKFGNGALDGRNSKGLQIIWAPEYIKRLGKPELFPYVEGRLSPNERKMLDWWCGFILGPKYFEE